MNDVIRITEEMRNEKLEITLKDGYQFKDENGNVINATKIVLEKKKKEPTYRPFKNKEECWEEMQKHQPFGWIIDKNRGVYYSITALNDVCSYYSCDCADSYSHLFKCSVFADGTPFGMKEE